MSNGIVQARYTNQDTERHDTLDAWGGIISARVSNLAEALHATPDQLLQALDELGIDPMVDTAQAKGRKNHDRPTDPSLRSMALTTGDVETLREELEGELEATG